MPRFIDDDPAYGDQAKAWESVHSGEPAKPVSRAMLDWMRRFQEVGLEMATDEECRKAIAARLFWPPSGAFRLSENVMKPRAG